MGRNSTFRLLGASNHADHERQKDDFYATEPLATKLLVRIEDFEGDILEPDCGQGHTSKDQRDWSKFKIKKRKFDPKTLQPFDKVLVKMSDDGYTTWFADFVSTVGTAYDRVPCVMSKADSDMVIPYNDETKHLVGTSNEAPEYYKYWED